MFEKFHRGDIYSADLSPGIGSEQSGSRPVLILQNNVGNCFSPTIIIAAITSVSKKSRKFPTHYHLNDRCGLVKPSVVMLEPVSYTHLDVYKRQPTQWKNRYPDSLY